MSNIVLSSNASGTGILTIASPNTNTNRTLTLPDNTGTVVSTGSSAVVSQSMLASGVAGNGPAFSAYQSASSQSISNSTFTKVTFDVEEFDTNNNFASSTFTPTVAGYYQISAHVGFSSTGATTGEALVTIYKNGARFKDGMDLTATSMFGFPVSALIYCNGTTDYLDVYIYQNSGSSKGLANNIYGTYFQATLVRAA